VASSTSSTATLSGQSCPSGQDTSTLAASVSLASAITSLMVIHRYSGASLPFSIPGPPLVRIADVTSPSSTVTFTGPAIGQKQTCSSTNE
jgi:hypothetical protein